MLGKWGGGDACEWREGTNLSWQAASALFQPPGVVLVLLVVLVLVIVLVAVLLQKCSPIPPSSWITAIKKMEKLTICLHRVSASAWILILQFQSRPFNKLTFECSTSLPTYQGYLYYAPLELLMLIAQTKCFTFISEKHSRARTPPQKYEFDDGVGVNWGDTIDEGRKHSAAKRWMINRIWFSIPNWCMYSIFYTPLPIYQG